MSFDVKAARKLADWYVESDEYGYAKSYVQNIRAACDRIEALECERDDLAMIVRRFVSKMKANNVAPSVWAAAEGYLQRKGLMGSILREKEALAKLDGREGER